MATLSLFKKSVEVEEIGPAVQALLNATQELETVKKANDKNAGQEREAREDIAAHEAATAELQQLQKQLLRARADLAVNGETSEDIADLETAVNLAQATVTRTAAASEFAAAKIEAIHANGAKTQAALKVLWAKLPRLRYAALAEKLNAHAPALLAAQNKLLAEWIEIFGTALAMDELATKENLHGPSAGKLWELDWCLPLPNTGNTAVAREFAACGIRKEVIHKAIKDYAAKVRI